MSKMMHVPDGWEIKPLKSIGICKSGLTYSPDDIVENGGLLVLRSSNIQNSQIALEDNVFVREDIKVNYKVQENDILVCVRNGSKNLIGKNALITKEVKDMAHGAFMTVFHSKINEYVFQIFQSDLFFKRVEKNLGATINSINNSDLLLFEFPFPKEKKEQEKIAKILSTLDKAIESTNRLIEKEKHIKTALMQELLTNGIDQKGQIRSPQTHTYKPSELGLIPDEWEVVSLKDVMTIQYGKDQKEVEVENGKYPILGSGGVIGYTNHCLYDKPSVLIGRKGTIDNPQYMETPFWTVDTLFYSHIKSNSFPKWVFYTFQTINWRAYNEASGVPSLSTSNINSVKIKKPPKEEQKQIAKILITQDKKIETEETNLAKLKELKKGLMNDLLSGKVRVQSVNEIKSIYQIYEEMFGESFDIWGLYWNDMEKQNELVLQCIEEEKIVWDILSKEELELIEEVKKGNVVF